MISRGLRGKMKANMYIFDQPFQEYNIRKFMLVKTLFAGHSFDSLIIVVGVLQRSKCFEYVEDVYEIG